MTKKPFDPELKAAYDFLVQKSEETVRFTGLPDMRLHLYYIGEGRNLRVSNMFDIDGTETDDPEAATSVVAEMPDGQWLAIECHGGDIVARPLS